jgi:hypothetical protein
MRVIGMQELLKGTMPFSRLQTENWQAVLARVSRAFFLHHPTSNPFHEVPRGHEAAAYATLPALQRCAPHPHLPAAATLHAVLWRNSATGGQEACAAAQRRSWLSTEGCRASSARVR